MIKLFVNKYQAVLAFSIMIILIGFASYFGLPRESAPEIRRPVIFVSTPFPGVSAKDVETLVTIEIEDEIADIKGVDSITSTSSLGLSQVKVEFDGDSDVEESLRRVRERVDVAKANLPADALEPIVKELNFSEQPILIITLSDDQGIEPIESVADFLEDEIKKVSGILDVTVLGKLEKELAIEIDPIRLKDLGLSLSDISKAIQNENITIPGGTLKNPVRTYSLSVSGEIKSPSEFREIYVKKDGKKFRLDQFATVSLKYKDQSTISRINKKPSISIQVKKRSGENLLRIADEVKEIIDSNRGLLPKSTEILYSFDQSVDVREMVADLENNILTALLLVLATTFFFLGPVNSIFVSLGIPFSMLMSFTVLSMMGITLNMIVLFSLVLALGMLVDNGIVIVENIYRHRSLGASRKEAAIKGTSEVALAITTSTLTTILAFFPIIYMPGIMGEFMSYLPKTVIIVLTSSLIVNITITTVFCSKYLRVSEKAMKAMEEGSGFFIRIQKVYEKTLRLSLRFPKSTVALAFFVIVLGIVLNGMFGAEKVFFPSLDPKVAVLEMKAGAGTPIGRSDEIMKILEKTTSAIPSSIESIQATTGRGAGSGRNESHKGNIRIGFKAFQEREIPGKKTIEGLQEQLSEFVDGEIKIREQKEGPPAGNDVSYEIRGKDYAILGEVSEKILEVVDNYSKSLEIIDTDFESSQPELMVEIDRQKAAHFGLSTRLIADTIRTAISGKKVSTFRDGKEEYDVRIRHIKTRREDIAALKELEIFNKGTRISLSNVADISHQSTVGVSKRNNRKRAVKVWADFKPDIETKEKIKKEIAAAVKEIALPNGYEIGQPSGADVRAESEQFLGQAFLMALLMIFIIMIIQFDSFSQPFIIMISVFLAVGGVFWGMFLTHQKFVIIMSGIGVVSLAGIVVNNAIVLIDFINVRIKEGVSPEEAIITGGITRLRPVILTAFTTVIGLIPMAFGFTLDFHNQTVVFGTESAAWWSPMAWSIIFGLTFATAMTLIVVPVLLHLDFKWFPKKIQDSE